MFHKLLIAYFGGFFVFWSLGIDQLVFFLFCIVGVFSYIAAEKYPLSRELLFFGFFVICTFFSFFHIETTSRYITYIRNESVYLAMFFIFVSTIFASARNGKTIDKLYFALLLFSLQCTVVAFLASNGISIAFKTLAGQILPDLGSKYLAAMMNKSSVQAEALWFAKGFYRPRGLMMYPNTMAGILASTMALKAYFVYKFWRDDFRFFAIVCLIAIYLDLFSIYSSLSRSTWAAMTIAVLVFPFVYKTRFQTKLLPLALGGFLITFVVLTGFSDGIESRLTEKTHSNEGRMLNYSLIWQETTSDFNTFLFGHGTQIDHELLSIPLGSHSTYLGIFFKYGILGSIFFVLFLFILYRKTVNLTKNVSRINTDGWSYLRPYFLCFALIIPVLQMAFIEVDVDFSYAMYFATLIFLIDRETQIVNERLADQG